MVDGTPYSKVCGIYRIENASTGDCYIGSSSDIRRRWQKHRNNLVRRIHDNAHLQRAWLKYGPDAFSVAVVETCARELLTAREQHHIDATRPAYNIAPKAGQGPGMAGKKHSPATLEKLRNAIFTEERRAAMRAAHTRRWTPEERERQSRSHLGKTRSPVARAKQGRSLRGHPLSEETKRKIGAANAARAHHPHSSETIQKMRDSQRTRRQEEKRCAKPLSAAEIRHLAELHEARKGTHHSAETRQRMSAAHKARRGPQP